eukprot:gene11385-4552_t
MGNQLIKKSQFDCKIVILGTTSSGKTTLFKSFLSEYEDINSQEIQSSLRRTFIKEFLLNSLRVTIDVGKLCLTSVDKFSDEKSMKILDLLIKEDKNISSERLMEIKDHFPKIWSDLAMKKNLGTLKNYECDKNFVSTSVMKKIEENGLFYLPSYGDIQYCFKTSTIENINHFILTEEINFEIIDVGKKSKNLEKICRNANLMIYLISLEDFQNEKKFSQIETSFNELVKMKNFKNSEIVVLFNKSDAYKEDDFEKLYMGNFHENVEIKNTKIWKKKHLIEIIKKHNTNVYDLETCLINSESIAKTMKMIKEITRKFAKQNHSKSTVGSYPFTKTTDKQVFETKPEKLIDTQTPIKILLLGPGEVGKSTIYKRICQWNNKNYSLGEYLVHKDALLGNIIFSFKKIFVILENDPTWRISLSQEENEFVDRLSNIPIDILSVSRFFNEEDVQFIKDLSTNKLVKSIIDHNHKYLVNDKIAYWIENIDTIFNIDSNSGIDFDLILSCQLKTTGIVRTNFIYKGRKFQLFDTGGQRNERKKWMNLYENVDAVLMIGALSQFNELCYEDEKTNKVQECLQLVEDLGLCKSLSNVPFYLYLNKHDIFIKELKNDTIKVAFPNCPEELVKLHDFHMNQSPLKTTFSWTEKILIKKESSFNIIKKPSTCCDIQNLGEDELSYILSFLTYRDILKFSIINTSFNEASTNDLLWKNVCLQYDPTLEEQKIFEYYDHSSEYGPWKFYFYQGKTVYLKIRNFIVDEFTEAFGKSDREFRSIYTTSVSSLENSDFITVLENTLDDILTLKKI